MDVTNLEMPDANGLDDLAGLSRRVEADEWREMAQARFVAGDNEEAAAYYEMSLDVCPTAEAYTGLAVTLAGRGLWDKAIEACEAAMELDPDLGNPYNDMAVYLSERDNAGDSERALELLEKAIYAPRYDCRHYPYYHKGRLLEQQGKFMAARDAYYLSLKIEPEWGPAIVGFRRALGWLN
jgi:tetratricopeptide (TPR) repeat protein